VLLLGGVEQVEEQGEGAADQLERVQVELSHLAGEVVAAALELAGAQVDRALLEPVDQRERLFAGARPHRVGQELVEELQIREELTSQVLGHGAPSVSRFDRDRRPSVG
jgi:hypothetical protein